MTLFDIRNLAYMLVGEDGDSTVDHNSQHIMNTFINTGLKELQTHSGDIETSTSLTVTSGTDYVAVPSDFLREKEILYKGLPLLYRPFQEFSWTASTRPSGRPWVYNIRQGRIYLDPIPNETGSNLTLYYYADPAALSLDSDSPTIPSAFHHLPAYFAAAHAKLRHGNLNRGSMLLKIFQAGKEELKQHVLYSRTKNELKHVRDEYGYTNQ